ncbi:MAG: hypothetical protein QG583_42 [Patescibacteria group bacterium]|nr:hypothetical protein [Patescibacteria group bacterium]
MGKSWLASMESMDSVFKRASSHLSETQIYSLRRAVTLFLSEWLSSYAQREGEKDNTQAIERTRAHILEADFDTFRSVKENESKFRELGLATDEDCKNLKVVIGLLKPRLELR